jgi:hypothetical protein
VPRVRSIELPPSYGIKSRRRLGIELLNPGVAPGEGVVRAIPPGWFLADAIEIDEEVARAFRLRSIEVGNLAQTTPGQTLSAIACAPGAPLRLLDWCPPKTPIVMKITNLSSKVAAFRCLLVGDQVDG